MTAVVVLFYWFIYRQTATWTFSSDGLCYMLDVEFGGPRNLLHPFHMAYSVLGRALYHVAQQVGYQGRAIFLMQSVNAILGAAALGIFYRTARTRFDAWSASVATLALGFSFAFWSEIVDPGCYALAAVATCLLLALLMSDYDKSPFRSGMAHGLAILVHFMLVMTVPAFLSRKSAVRYLMGVSLVVGLAYGGMVLYLGSLKEFVVWFLDPAWKPQTQFLSQNYLHWNLTQNLIMSGREFRDSLVRMAPAWPMGWTVLSSLIVIGFLLAVVSGSVWVHRNRKGPEGVKALWIWILSLSGFQFFYASDTRFRILWLPAFFWLALEAGRAPFLRARWKWIAGFLPVIIWINFHGTIQPRSQPQTNPSLLRTLWVNHHLTSKDFFLFRGREPESIINFYAAYFAHDVPARSLEGFYFTHAHAGLAPLDDLVRTQEKRGQRLVFEEILWNPAEKQRLAELSDAPLSEVTHWMAQWHPVARIAAPDGYRLVEVARQAR